MAVTIDPGAGGVDPDVAEGVRKAASALAAAGYIVEEAEPPSIVEGAELWGALLFADVNATLRPVMERTASRDAMHVLDFFTVRSQWINATASAMTGFRRSVRHPSSEALADSTVS